MAAVRFCNLGLGICKTWAGGGVVLVYLVFERARKKLIICIATFILQGDILGTRNIWQLVTGNRKENQFSFELHRIILAKVQKGYKFLLKKIKSAFPVKMHINTLCPS